MNSSSCRINRPGNQDLHPGIKIRIQIALFLILTVCFSSILLGTSYAYNPLIRHITIILFMLNSLYKLLHHVFFLCISSVPYFICNINFWSWFCVCEAEQIGRFSPRYGRWIRRRKSLIASLESSNCNFLFLISL